MATVCVTPQRAANLLHWRNTTAIQLSQDILNISLYVLVVYIYTASVQQQKQ